MPHAHAAAPRHAWVVNQVHAWNHPYAASAGNELACKMEKMAQGAFNFYRGTAHIYYHDLRTRPASAYATAQGAQAWLSGDAHLANFDASRDATGKAVFKSADADEGYFGPYVWDLRRLATSFVLAGRENGIDVSDIATAIASLVGAYASQIASFDGSNAELAFQLSHGNTSGVVRDTISAADACTHSAFLDKYTQAGDHGRAFRTTSTLQPVSSATHAAIVEAMPAYIGSIAASRRHAADFYAVHDIRQRLGSGVGNLGKLRYYVLVPGASGSKFEGVILEFKQASPSAVAIAGAGRMPASYYDHHEGERVAKTARAQQLHPDVLIGYTSIDGVPYFVHEKSAHQKDFDPAALASAHKLDTAAGYFGQALASAHALADRDCEARLTNYSIDKQVSEAITSKSGLVAEISAFAFDYAAQATLDWQGFVAAYKAGTPLY